MAKKTLTNEEENERMTGNPNTSLVTANKDGGATWGRKTSGLQRGARTYTASEVDAIIARGDSGGSLSRQDQQVYQKFNRENRGMKTNAQIASEAEIAKEQRAQQARQENAVFDQGLKDKSAAAEFERKTKAAQEAAAAKAKAQADLATANNQAKADLQAQKAKDEIAKVQAKQKAKDDAARAKAVALNQQYGLADDYQLTKEQQVGLDKGTHRVGYSESNQKKVDELNSTYDDAVSSGIFSAEDLERLKKDRDAGIASIRKEVVRKPESEEPVYSSDGTMYRKGNNWEKSPKYEAEAARQEARRKWVAEHVSKMTDSEGNPLTPEARRQAVIDLQQLYEEAGANAPSTEQTQPVSNLAGLDWAAAFGGGAQTPAWAQAAQVGGGAPAAQPAPSAAAPSATPIVPSAGTPIVPGKAGGGAPAAQPRYAGKY